MSEGYVGNSLPWNGQTYTGEGFEDLGDAKHVDLRGNWGSFSGMKFIITDNPYLPEDFTEAQKENLKRIAQHFGVPESILCPTDQEEPRKP